MKFLKRTLLCLLLILFLLVGTIFAFGYWNYVKATNEISLQDKIEEIRNREDYVEKEKISQYVLDAAVAIEDHRFYDHGGVDLSSTGRAFLQNIFAKNIVGGGSTITQQLAKNMYFGYHASFTRKVSELLVALDLEKALTKDEILELYVNIINYGDGYIGISKASQGYFGKAPQDLTLEEASLLAGLPQSPANYQLSNHLKEARQRQKQVLNAMEKYQYIEKSEKEELLQTIAAKEHPAN